MQNNNFHVIIAGGGVAGLTLASTLEKINVDYVLLESRSEVTPYAGASIAINANGGRILAQLDAYDNIHANTLPIDWLRSWKDGKVVMESDGARLSAARYTKCKFTIKASITMN